MSQKINTANDLTQFNTKLVDMDNIYPILKGRELHQQDDKLSGVYNDIQVTKGFYNLSNRTNNKILINKTDEYNEKKNIKETIHNDVNSTNRVLEIYENSMKSNSILTQKIYVFVFFLLSSLIIIILGKFKYIDESLMKIIVVVLALVFGSLGFYIFYINRINKPTNLDKKKFLNLGVDDIRQKEINDLGWYAQAQAHLEEKQNLKNITDKLSSFNTASDKLFYILEMKQQEAIENEDYNIAAYYTDLIMYYKIHPVKDTNEIVSIFNDINSQEKNLENNNITANLKKELKDKIHELKKQKKNLNKEKRRENRQEDRLNNKVDDIQAEIDNYKEISDDINNQLATLNYEIQDNMVLQQMIASTASPTPTSSASPTPTS